MSARTIILSFLVMVCFGASAQVPTITGFNPESGPVGTSVTITGTNFSATPANNIVYFGATRAAVSSAGTTSLTVEVPSGASFQPITVLANNLLAYSSVPFRVTFSGGLAITASSLAPKVDFTTETQPIFISTGDFDLDGKPDLAITNNTNTSLSVLRNTSTGAGTISYATKVDLTTGTQPFGISVGDLDNDGKSDVAVANLGGNSVSVLRNTSTGPGSISFAAKVDFAMVNQTLGVAIGDLDGDGKGDLVATNTLGTNISVFRNTSTGPGNVNFAARVDFTVGSAPRSIAVADLDGDGKKDVAVVNLNSNTVSVLRNISTGVGSISFATKVDLTAATQPTSMSAADLDGDGKIDLALSHINGNVVSAFRNTSTGPGTISYAARTDIATVALAVSLSTGDLDGDGMMDLAVANGSSTTVSLLRNISTPGTIGYTTKIDFTTTGTSGAVLISDMDGDSKPDLAVTNGNPTNSVSVFRNAVVESEPTAQPTGPINFTNITTSSFEGDFGVPTPAPQGYLVLMSANVTPDFVPVDGISYDYNEIVGTTTIGSNNIYVVQNENIPAFNIVNISPPATLFFKVYSFNGSGPTVNYLTTSPLSGSQAPLPPTISSFSPTSGPIGMTVSIFGSNFDTDPTDNIVYFGATRATVTNATTSELTVTVPAGSTYHPVTVAVNGLTAYSSQPFILSPLSPLVLDANLFAPKVSIPAGNAPFSPTLVDLDIDGRADLITSNANDNSISIIRNVSTAGAITTGSFEAKVDFSVGGLPKTVSAGDLDGDGRKDIVVSNFNGTSISIFRNTTTSGAFTASSLASRVDLVTDPQPNSVKVADIDGDGKPEIVYYTGTGPGNAKISILRNVATTGSIGTSSFLTAVDLLVSENVTDVAISDLDLDGKPEIIATTTSNHVAVYKNAAVPGIINAGSFLTKVNFTTIAAASALEVGDIDNDGLPEVVIANAPTNNISVFENNISGGVINVLSFNNRADFNVGSNPSEIGLSDLDGDGKVDVVVDNSDNTISLLRNTSSVGTINGFSLTGTSFSAPSLYGLALGDVDGDSAPDLLLSDGSTVDIYKSKVDLAPQPTAQSPGPITFSNITTNSFDGSFPQTTPMPAGYLVLMSANVAPNFVPVDGVAYANNSVVGSVSGNNIYVVQNTSTPGFSIVGINPPETLHFKVYSFNGSGLTTNYLTTNPLSGSQSPLPPEPTIQAANLVITQPSANTLNISWTNGNGTNRLVVGRAGGTVSQFPVDGSTYAASASFSSGNDLGGGNYVVYKGTGNSVSVTDVQPGTSYQFFVFEFIGTAGTENYLPNSATGNPNDFTTAGPLEPTIQATNLIITQLFANTLNLSWTNGNGTNRLVVGRAGGTVSQSPVDGSTYAASASFSSGDDLGGGNYVVYKGTGNSVSVTDIQPSTTYQFFVFEFNGAAGIENYLIITASGNPNSITTSGTLDTDPPVVNSNGTPNTIALNTDLVVTANFTDAGTGVDYAELEYRPIAGVAPNDFITVDMEHTSGSTYTYTIPGSEINDLGIEYRFLVTDFANNDNSLDPRTLYRTRIRYDNGLLIPYASPGRDVTNYRIISVPLVLDDKSANTVIGSWLGNYDPTQWTLYRWEGGPNFVELNGSTQFEVGKGYWFLTYIGTDLNSGPGTTADVGVDAPFQILLRPGWNQIGNPYNFDIAWSDVIAANPTHASNLGNDSKIRVFRGTADNVDELKSFEGGFVRNTSTGNITIDIPVSKNLSINGRKAIKGPLRNAIQEPNWEVMFNLTQGEYVYNLGGLGMHMDAKTGYDEHDDYNLPRFFEYLEVKYPRQHVGMSVTKDVVPTAENFVWEFSVETNLSGGATSIEWDNSYFGTGKEIYLVDQVEHRAINMLENDSYSFTSSPSRPFKVVFGDSEYVKNEILPGQPILFSPYPNPFMERVTISYTLPNEVITQGASLDIYTAQGTRVSTLALPPEPGEGSWEWVSGQPSGMYFVRLQMGNQMVVKKIIKQ